MTAKPFDGGGMSPAEHLEAFLAGMGHLGWNAGAWEFRVHSDNGRIRAVVPHPVLGAERPQPLGRRALDEPPATPANS